jgi:hypothetical protein
VDPVPDPLLLRKSGSAGNRTRTSGSLTTRLHKRSLRQLSSLRIHGASYCTGFHAPYTPWWCDIVALRWGQALRMENTYEESVGM